MALQEPSSLIFIGLGGIGSWLVEPVIRYFRAERSVILVDGDHVEAKNLARQSFSSNEVRVGKADGLAGRLHALFPGLMITPRAYFVDEVSVKNLLMEHAAVFVNPDNHRARRVVANEAKKRENIAVFTAGNELYDGSCHVYVKQNGVELTRDFIRRHPEAVDPPEQLEGCTELIDRGATQLIAVNFMVAALALMAVHQVYCYGSFRDKKEVWSKFPQEVYGSIIDGGVRTAVAPKAVEKKPRKKKKKEKKKEKKEVAACLS